MVRIRRVGFFGILSSPVVLCLPHLSATGGHAVSRKWSALSLPDMLQAGLSLPVPITKSKLRSSSPNGELSGTGSTERHVRGDMMISRRSTLAITLAIKRQRLLTRTSDQWPPQHMENPVRRTNRKGQSIPRGRGVMWEETEGRRKVRVGKPISHLQ